MHYNEAKQQLIEYFQQLHEKGWGECIVCFFNQGEIGNIKPEGKHFLLTNSTTDVYPEIVVSKESAKHYAGLFRKYEPAIIAFVGNENVTSSLRSRHRNGISIAYGALEFMQNELRSDLLKLEINIDMNHDATAIDPEVERSITDAIRAGFAKSIQDEAFQEEFNRGFEEGSRGIRRRQIRIIRELDQAGIEPTKAAELGGKLIRKFARDEKCTPKEIVIFIKRGLGKRTDLSSIRNLAQVAANILNIIDEAR